MQSNAVAAPDGSRTPRSRPILSIEPGCTVKVLTEDRERRQALGLRHKVFCQELEWVAAKKK